VCTTNVHRQRQVVWQCTNCVQWTSVSVDESIIYKVQCPCVLCVSFIRIVYTDVLLYKLFTVLQ
jgi:hypothetical protein